MFIPDELIPGINTNTRPLLINRNADGSYKTCRVLRVGEFVVTPQALKEVCSQMGLYIVDRDGNRL